MQLAASCHGSRSPLAVVAWVLAAGVGACGGGDGHEAGRRADAVAATPGDGAGQTATGSSETPDPRAPQPEQTTTGARVETPDASDSPQTCSEGSASVVVDPYDTCGAWNEDQDGDGDDDVKDCYLANTKGCSTEVLDAFCKNQFGGDGSAWFALHDKWLAEVCRGLPVENTGLPLFTSFCQDSETCTRYVSNLGYTPIVLAFDERGAVAYEAAGACTTFDLSPAGDGSGTLTDWPTAATPWLALDVDGDGRITSGRELFGSATMLNGRPARDGFQALSALDADGDGDVDADDPGFAKLVAFRDTDGDRVGVGRELEPLSELGIVALELDYRVEAMCDGRGNCGRERAPFRWLDRTGALRRGTLVDVHLAAPARPRG